MINSIVIGLLFGLSFCCTGIFRRYALRKGLMDLPNERSSHIVPTPRGGGMVFVALSVVIWTGLLGWQYWHREAIISGNLYFLVSSLLIATLGFIDDRLQLSAIFRLCCQLAVFSLFLYWLVGVPFLYSYGYYSLYEILGLMLFVGFGYFFLLWVTNLFNFMDGIDGIAATQAIFFLGSVSFFYQDMLFYPLSDMLWYVPPLLAGFLVWNFPRAKLFMGDAGSSFLGAFIAFICLYLATTSLTYFLVCIILLAVFISDATLTLMQRFFNGENIFQAHRSHAYQHASRYFGSHVPVTTAVTTINLFWLLPWAYIVATGMGHAVYSTLAAYAPIVVLAFYFKAGKREAPEEQIMRQSENG